MSSVGLYVNGAISLSISSLVEEYKCAKVRLELTLNESQDPLVHSAAPTLATRRKLKLGTAVVDAKTIFRHWEIVGMSNREGEALG